ncbi:hypothetical protein AVEN_45328-1 [Araneus ventricosus]|uniref:RNase H type-1 domain-containing protein n=1 Tax=Araneus ventricosus TaxID=182803 RepID=A0A4Y2ICE7_ARAVE|nr:hypothetical protein AVEN_45328-1 [Araneus ventricosus]
MSWRQLILLLVGPWKEMLRSKCFLIASPLLNRLEAPKSNLIFILSVKDNLYNAKHLVSLVSVKAHTGNPGNELADHFAKMEADMSITAPYSYVKRVCKEFLMSEWNSYWKNSTTGKSTKEILLLANPDLLISNKYAIYLLKNH